MWCLMILLEFVLDHAYTNDIYYNLNLILTMPVNWQAFDLKWHSTAYLYNSLLDKLPFFINLFTFKEKFLYLFHLIKSMCMRTTSYLLGYFKTFIFHVKKLTTF